MPVSEKMFSYATDLTVKAYADPTQRITMLADLAAMSTYSQVSARIETLKALVYKIEASKPQPVAGHYVIDGAHVEIKIGKASKTAYVIKDGCYLGSKHDDAKAILADVLANGQTYAIAYAAKTGKCGVCNTKLTDPKSIAAGIGPICAKKF